MRIKALTLRGFKSFADRTRIELHDGVTAVVGPNGCGKSNISDALRWVLGEQRPTAIRGSRMEEAIFGGTEVRKPINRAEVLLELSNEDGALPVSYAEVAIGRTVYRGGESEYTLNGAPCRLKDILDLCRDTGLGANAYALIEGRMIDAILSDRAEERRALFEEAAGVGRYKDRRRIATRQLEQAESDLERLDDVLIEVGSKVRSLAQQRGRAERHARLRDRLLQLEVAVAGARLERTGRRLAEARAEREGLARETPPGQVDIRTTETRAETLRIRHAELERERAGLARRVEEARRALEDQERALLLAQERITNARDRLSAVGAETRRLERRRAGLVAGGAEAEAAFEAALALAAEGSRIEAELREEADTLAAEARAAASGRDAAREAVEQARREAERWRLELSVTEARARDRSEELERHRPALDSLAGQERELRGQAAKAAALESGLAERARRVRDGLQAAQDAAAAAEEALRRAREAQAALEGRLATASARASSLGSLVGSSALLPEVVARLLEDRAEIPGLHGALSEFMEAPAPWAAAVEAHLGPCLHGVVVRDWSTVRAVEAWLERSGAEEGVLVLPLEPGPLSVPAAVDAPLLDKVEAKGAGAVWVTALLSGVGVADDGELAPRAHPWVDADGRHQDPRGAVYLGRGTGGEGVLSRRAELRALREEVVGLERTRARSTETLQRLESEVAAARERVDGSRTAASEVESARREAEADRASAEARLKRLDRERRELTGRIEQLEAFGDDEVARSATGETRGQELERLASRSESAWSAASDTAREARDAAEAGRADLHRAQLEQARREADVENRRAAAARVAENLADAEERARALAREETRLHALIAESERLSEEAEAAIGQGLEIRAQREAELAGIEGRIAEGRELLERLDSELREARRLERERVEARHRLDLEITQLEAAESSVRGRLEAEWDAPLAELRGRVSPVDDAEPDEWEAELERVRRSIARLGPVNLLAQQEYEEERARLEFLTGQRDDLTGAGDDLRTSIRRINREASAVLSETFEAVRANFHRTFVSLFEGGECDVWFEDPEDPLDSPIEISASPRGKRTQRIHLLSGGERALTALALLFAIYLAKPSPFCLLDEVDAPLDETNILRFVRMLKEFKRETQFIVITHNPLTIENSDWIYGVTMQEAGVSSIVGVEFDSAPQVA
ncbi:chromosome segregation protein SMC [Candidatus Palauibacter sp.]|uniref:chromosome segregation protein SMC n=1 Tax=Candidatus Palauibacter sp. TaxID=3101350 RepID=UPI003B5259F8